MQAKDGIKEKLCADNDGKRVNLKYGPSDLVHLIQELCGNCFI